MHFNWLDTILDKITGVLIFSKIDAAVSSQLDSIPRIIGFLLIQINSINSTISLQYEKRKNYYWSRGSKLALIYAQKVKNKILEKTEFKEDQITIKGIVTKGDKVSDRRLSDLGGKGLFSKNIEKELLDKKIDIAVHALKDMPAAETKGLLSNFFLKRNDPREILISRDNIKLKDLNPSI